MLVWLRARNLRNKGSTERGASIVLKSQRFIYLYLKFSHIVSVMDYWYVVMKKLFTKS